VAYTQQKPATVVTWLSIVWAAVAFAIAAVLGAGLASIVLIISPPGTLPFVLWLVPPLLLVILFIAQGAMFILGGVSRVLRFVVGCAFFVGYGAIVLMLGPT
jgi:hypothetical protein